MHEDRERGVASAEAVATKRVPKGAKQERLRSSFPLRQAAVDAYMGNRVNEGAVSTKVSKFLLNWI